MNTLVRLLQYLLKAKGAHGIHSPFVFELYQKVISSDTQYYDFGAIEKLREQLLHSDEVIETIDYGAGASLPQDLLPQTSRNESGTGSKRASKSLSTNESNATSPIAQSPFRGLGLTTNRKLSHITRHTSVSPSNGQILFRLVNFMQPKILVEMGTSVGISTLYLAKASESVKVITMEGSPNVAAVAARNFSILKANNIEQVVGEFGETLPELVKNISHVDFVFFDGNHRKEATLEYFHTFLPLASSRCVFVFDDIRWSDGMFEAWNEIIKYPASIVTIDLFSFGFVFLNLKQAKEDFILWKKLLF